MPSAAMLIVVLAVGAASAVEAQAPAPPATGTAVIRGRVVAGDTGKPLRRARVTIAQPGRGAPRNVDTDSDGRYEAKELPAGQYVVTASRSGYLQLRYGQRRPLEGARPIDVADARTIEHIDFALPRTGVIEGRVVDETGDAMGGATIVAMRAEYFQGRRQLVPIGAPTSTDDAGHYRVIGLPPGSYVLNASTRETWPVLRDGKKVLMAFAPTYFPGAAGVKEAESVTVGIGEHVTDWNVAMVPVRTVTVSGTALDTHGAPASNVGLVRNLSGPNGGFVGMAGTAAPAADGRFVLRDILPGAYTLKAVGTGEVATLPMVVGNADIADVSLVTSAGWSAKGTVTTERGTPPDIPRERVRITVVRTSAVAPMMMSGEPTPRQVLNDDWTFSATAIVGNARFRATLPEGWIVKSVLHNGRDITDTAIELKSGDELSGVQVVVTDRIGTVTAEVVDGKGAAVTDGSMLFFASDREKWSDGSLVVRAARANQQGKFQVKGLPAGEYLAIALDYVQEGMWNDADYLESLRRSAQKVTLSDGESVAISLKLAAP